MGDLIYFRFYAELKDFLPARKRNTGSVPYTVKGKNQVKDAIESFGIPHTEVDLILANGRSVPFTYYMKGGDRISVYPVFESLDIHPNRLRPTPLRKTAFILDVHLGRLARWLRTAGFDTLYRNDYPDNEIIEVAVREKRIILTRDIGILKNGKVTHGYFVRETDPGKQFGEIIRRFQLSRNMKPFSRCIHCNHMLVKVKKSEVASLLKPLTRKYYDDFSKCPECGKTYWKGGHYKRMKQRLDFFLKQTE